MFIDNEFQLLQTFSEDQFEDLRANVNGKVADYIPQLAKPDPSNFAISV